MAKYPTTKLEDEFCTIHANEKGVQYSVTPFFQSLFPQLDFEPVFVPRRKPKRKKPPKLEDSEFGKMFLERVKNNT